MADYDLTIKIILLGDFSVNKGALMRALGAMSPTPQVWCLEPRRVGLLEMMFIRPDEKKVRAKIQDTAGQERFRSITSSFYRGAHGCVLLFDVTNKTTFDSLPDWIQELQKYSRSEEVVATLAGCNSHVTGSQRQVSVAAAQAFANHVGFLYEEICAKHIVTLVDLLEKMIDRILLNASRLPLLSISILPLDQKMEEKYSLDSKRKCGC